MKYKHYNFLIICAICVTLLQVSYAQVPGNYYFWNTVTGEVTWKDPSNVPYISKETGDKYYVDKDGKTTWENPHPSDWTEAVHETHKVPYFYNSKTDEVTWERPIELGWKRVNAYDEL